MRRIRIALLAAALVAVSGISMGYVIGNWWDDGDDIVMDDVLAPADPWSAPAQFQMSEFNEIDTTDNSHPFRINVAPELSFGANDGDNTIGFLGEAGLSSEYGLSYAMALAWTACWSSGTLVECDVMLDPTLPWNLGPDDSNWFQSTVLHELGHVRGLDHYNGFLSMQNSGTSKYLRNETLYMDDKVAIRQNASFVSERDLTIYNKWHDGALPQWMSMSPTTLREGDVIDFQDITVENRGSQSFDSTVRFGVYLSTNDTISTADELLNTGSFPSFGTFAFSTFDWSATIPTVEDCGTRYVGGIIDDDEAWDERYEGNNSVTFTDGVAFTGSSYTPTPLEILLAEDGFEPDDSAAQATGVALPFAAAGLSIDEDAQQDYFGFSLTCEKRVEAELTFSHALGDIDLDLRTSGDGLIEASTSATDGESIVRDLAAGSYFARAYGFGAGSCNRYDISIDAEDVTAPEVVAPDPVTLECNSPGGIPASDPDIQSWLAAATAEDECEGPIGDIDDDAPGFFPAACPPGAETVVTFTASDSQGNEGSAMSSITVVDSEGPAVTCDVAVPVLWSPNHGLVDVGLTFGAMDDCASEPLVFGVSVSSDEDAANAPGSGGPMHCPDAVIGDDLSVLLRAERSGSGDGRVYVITVSATDSCGNVGICQVPVTVPSDQMPGGSAIDSGQIYDATACASESEALESVASETTAVPVEFEALSGAPLPRARTHDESTQRTRETRTAPSRRGRLDGRR